MYSFPPSKPSARISRVTFSGGQTISFGANDKVLIVGPNNCGKSQTLRDIKSEIAKHPNGRGDAPVAINSIGITKYGNAKMVQSLLEDLCELRDQSYHYRSNSLHVGVEADFNGTSLFRLAPLFCNELNAEGRLNLASVVDGSGRNQKSAPQHYMFDDTDLMAKISDHFRNSFGQDLFFDFRAHPQIPIHVGQQPTWTEDADRISNEYAEKVRAYPLLHKQGDGMRSYAGLLFQICAFEDQITLIDEPEAFLHPPQMRRLGKLLAEEIDNQAFIATHSIDILKGFLDADVENVRVVRLHREGNRTSAFEMTPGDVSEIWRHPQLRYSNILDAIFHEQVVICEDDSDCRLFHAIADHNAARDAESTRRDTLFVSVGGKHGIPRAVDALKQLGVPTKVVADIDLIDDWTLLSRLIESQGGNPADCQDNWVRIAQSVGADIPIKTPEEIAEEITDLLKPPMDGLPKSQISALMKQTRAWTVLKDQGSGALPEGEPLTAFEELNAALQSLFIFIIEQGEIESFADWIGGHGPRFVSALLQSTALDDERLDELRSFVDRFVLSP